MIIVFAVENSPLIELDEKNNENPFLTTINGVFFEYKIIGEIKKYIESQRFKKDASDFFRFTKYSEALALAVLIDDLTSYNVKIIDSYRNEHKKFSSDLFNIAGKYYYYEDKLKKQEEKMRQEIQEIEKHFQKENVLLNKKLNKVRNFWNEELEKTNEALKKSNCKMIEKKLEPLIMSFGGFEDMKKNIETVIKKEFE